MFEREYEQSYKIMYENARNVMKMKNGNKEYYFIYDRKKENHRLN